MCAPKTNVVVWIVVPVTGLEWAGADDGLIDVKDELMWSGELLVGTDAKGVVTNVGETIAG